MKTLTESIIGKRGNTPSGFRYDALRRSGMLVRIEDIKDHSVSDFITVTQADCTFPEIFPYYNRNTDVIMIQPAIWRAPTGNNVDYWPCNVFKDDFPKCGNFRITGITPSDIDVMDISSYEELKKIFDKYDLKV